MASNVTRDHDTIRAWVEERGGTPAKVDTGGKGGVLRIDFGPTEDRLDPINWDEFFRIFDEAELDFLYEDTDEGGQSRFYTFVARHG